MNKNHPLQAVVDQIMRSLTEAPVSKKEPVKNVRNTNDLIESSILAEYYFSGLEGVAGAGKIEVSSAVAERLQAITHCHLVLCNGYVVTGKTVDMNMTQYSRKLGEEYAREDAIKNAQPLAAFLMMERDAVASQQKEMTFDELIDSLIRT